MTDNQQPATALPDARSRLLLLFAALWVNLLKAIMKKKTDRSAFYAPNFRDGLCAIDMERSAAAAGENPAEFRRHLALVDRVLLTLCGYLPPLTQNFDPLAGPSPTATPPASARIETGVLPDERSPSLDGANDGEAQAAHPELINSGLTNSDSPSLPLKTDAHSPRPPKLVRALALIAWKVMRLLRTQGAWEYRAICYRLQKLAEWRHKYGPLTPKRLEQFRQHALQTFTNSLTQVRKEKRLKKRFWKLWKIWCQAAGLEPNAPGAQSGPRKDGGGKPPKPESRRADVRVASRPSTPLVSSRGVPSGDAALQENPGDAGPVGCPGVRNISDNSNSEAAYEAALEDLDRGAECPAACIVEQVPEPDRPPACGVGRVREPDRPAPDCAEDHDPKGAFEAKAEAGIEGAPSAGPLADMPGHDAGREAGPAGEPSPPAAASGEAGAAGRESPLPGQFHPAWNETLDQRSPEALSDAVRSPSHAERGQKKAGQPASLKDPDAWDGSRSAHGQHRGRKRRQRKDDEADAELFAKDFRYPADSYLRRLIRSGKLNVPEDFEGFLALVLDAFGPPPSEISNLESGVSSGSNAQPSVPGVPPSTQPAAPSGISNLESAISSGPNDAPSAPVARLDREATSEFAAGNPAGHKPAASESLPEFLPALAAALWERTHVFTTGARRLADLLEATLNWNTGRIMELWEELFPPVYGFDMIFSLKMYLAGSGDWADEPPARGRREPRERDENLAEWTSAPRFRELKRGLQAWFDAVECLVRPVSNAERAVQIALYDLASNWFGIRRQFLEWRPKLNVLEWAPRKNRPEWLTRVKTIDGRTFVKLEDGRILEKE